MQTGRTAAGPHRRRRPGYRGLVPGCLVWPLTRPDRHPFEGGAGSSRALKVTARFGCLRRLHRS